MKCLVLMLSIIMLVIVISGVEMKSIEQNEDKISTPAVHHKWTRSEIMDTNGLYLLEWKIDGKDIVFKVTVNTRGFIGLGFSYKTGLMAKSDLVLAWVDDRTGKPNVLVCTLIIFNH